MMSSDLSARLLVRDASEGDIPSCLALDHSYETDQVWQMQVNEEPGSAWEIDFRLERLPRRIEIAQAGEPARLKQMVGGDTCFLIASERGTREPFGYLTMRHDCAQQLGILQDLVVSRPFRRQHIATRLLNVARRWGKERGILRLNAEIGTKNHPGSLFLDQMGFRLCGFNDKYLHSGDIALFFSQALR